MNKIYFRGDEEEELKNEEPNAYGPNTYVSTKYANLVETKPSNEEAFEKKVDDVLENKNIQKEDITPSADKERDTNISIENEDNTKTSIDNKDDTKANVDNNVIVNASQINKTREDKTAVKKSENTPTGEKPVNVKKELFGWVVYIAIIIAISFLIVKFVGMRTTVSGSSMNNTLYNGDQLIINKIGYRLHKPERFDIIVFPYQYKKDTYYIKRVIGLPGETVQIKEVDGNGYYVFINGKQLKSDVYGREVMNMPGLAENPIKLGEDEYFVLGDNRNNSEDSRFPDVAEIKGKDIVGKAFFRIYPFKDFGLIKHK